MHSTLCLAIGLLMTPVAYHRLAERVSVSRKLINIASKLITVGRIPLMFAFAIDVYVVILTAVDSPQIGFFGALATVCILAGLCFLFPLRKRTKS